MLKPPRPPDLPEARDFLGTLGNVLGEAIKQTGRNMVIGPMERSYKQSFFDHLPPILASRLTEHEQHQMAEVAWRAVVATVQQINVP